MEDFSEFLGWANVVLFGLVVLLGLLLRFGKLKEPRKMVAAAHRIVTVLAVASLLAHFLTVEDKPLLLIVLSLAAVVIPVGTMVLKRMKKLSFAITAKLVLVPLLAIGLFAGHLGKGEGNENGRGESSYESDNESGED